MAKTFAKIAKMFVGLSATIISIKRRHVLILYLEAKNAKIDCKNEIYQKKKKKLDKKHRITKSQLSQKINSQIVESQRSIVDQSQLKMTPGESANDVEDDLST